MKISLPKDKVKEFLDKASFIDNSGESFFPILKYIKIEIVFGTCVLTKTNNVSFCTMSFDVSSDDISILVEEKKLNVFCDNSTEESFTIIQKENKVFIKDSSCTQTMNAGAYKMDEYPKIPAEVPTVGRITDDIIKYLSVSKATLGTDDIKKSFQFSYMKGDTMYSSNGHCIFTRKFNRPLPELSITKKEISIFSNFGFIDYARSDNYNTYKHGNTIYGFIISEEAIGIPYERFINDISKENFAKVKVSDIIKFCSSTIKFAESKFTDSDFEFFKDVARLRYEDNEKGEENTLEIDCILTGEPFKFRFLPTVWKDILSSVPYDEICIGLGRSYACVWTPQDEGYNAILSKYQ